MRDDITSSSSLPQSHPPLRLHPSKPPSQSHPGPLPLSSASVVGRRLHRKATSTLLEKHSAKAEPSSNLYSLFWLIFQFSWAVPEPPRPTWWDGASCGVGEVVITHRGIHILAYKSQLNYALFLMARCKLFFLGRKLLV